MTHYTLDQIFTGIQRELEWIWKQHVAAGLSGKICLYSEKEQDVIRAKEPGLRLWFNADEIFETTKKLRRYYNDGGLPNSPLLLNPMVHSINENGSYEPIGSGIFWATAPLLGTDIFDPTALDRLHELGAITGILKRGENARAGLKIVLPTTEVAQVITENKVQGTLELFSLANLKSDIYADKYLLGGLVYLTKHGAYEAPPAQEMFKAAFANPEAVSRQNYQTLADAAECWVSYDREPSLYAKFGRNPQNIEKNLRFYNLCARDIALFEATGTQRASTEEQFEFLVGGWLPRGAITVMGATGGTGKSSMAHRLAVMTSIDWNEDEHPTWLGGPLHKDKAQGLVIYFSGEDSAAIVNARAAMIDPEGRSSRLMLQHNDFGFHPDGQKRNIGDFLRDLHKLPDISLIVIDPARKYLEGDEDDSEVVSNFFEAIEEISIKKKCAIVVVHHLAKLAHPKDTRDIVDLLRGSQVFIDRPRVVIGMMRDGAYTVVGLSKNNIPPNLGMIQGERLFVRDAENLDLIWLPGPKGVRTFTVSEEEIEQIKAAAEAEAAALDAKQ